MAGKGDALVIIGADASAVKKAAAETVSAWKDVGRSISTEIGNATQSIVNDLGRIVTAQGQVNFSQQHQQVREFEAATARMAVATGRDLETVRKGAETMGVEIGKRPSEVNAWAVEVGRLTGNFQGAEKSIRGFAGLAAATNRSVDDYRSLAVEITNIGHVSGDSTHALGVMTAQAELLGTTGGPAAFADQIAGLTETISHFAVSSEADFVKVTAAAAVLGKGLNPLAAARVQRAALSFIASDTVGTERFLGHKITNNQGQVVDPMGSLFEYRDKINKVYGSSMAQRIMRKELGDEAGAAVWNAKASDVAAAAKVKPSKANEDAINRYLHGTDAGGRDVAQAELAKASRDLLGSSTALGRAADALQKFAASHPVASTVASTATAGIVGAVAGAVGKSTTLAIRAGSRGALGAAGRGALALGGATVAGIATLVGAGIAGAYGIKKFEAAQDDRFRLEDKAADVAAESALGQRKLAMRRANAAAHGLEGLTPEQRGAAINATSNVIQHAKDSMGALQLSHGGGNMIAALVAELRRQGQSDAAAEKIAKVLDDRLKNVTIQVSAGPETAVTAAATNGNRPSTGHQGH